MMFLPPRPQLHHEESDGDKSSSFSRALATTAASIGGSIGNLLGQVKR